MRIIKAVVMNNEEREMLEAALNVNGLNNTMEISDLLHLLSVWKTRKAILHDLIGPMHKKLCTPKDHLGSVEENLNELIDALKSL